MEIGRNNPKNSELMGPKLANHHYLCVCVYNCAQLRARCSQLQPDPRLPMIAIQVADSLTGWLAGWLIGPESLDNCHFNLEATSFQIGLFSEGQPVARPVLTGLGGLALHR